MNGMMNGNGEKFVGMELFFRKISDFLDNFLYVPIQEMARASKKCWLNTSTAR